MFGSTAVHQTVVMHDALLAQERRCRGRRLRDVAACSEEPARLPYHARGGGAGTPSPTPAARTRATVLWQVREGAGRCLVQLAPEAAAALNAGPGPGLSVQDGSAVIAAAGAPSTALQDPRPWISTDSSELEAESKSMLNQKPEVSMMPGRQWQASMARHRDVRCSGHGVLCA